MQPLSYNSALATLPALAIWETIMGPDPIEKDEIDPIAISYTKLLT